MAIQNLRRIKTNRVPLPYDLLHIILQLLKAEDALSTLAALQRCSSSFYKLITPMLYTHVHIHSDEQLQRFLALPSDIKVHRKGKLGLIGSKRARSGSIQTPQKKMLAFTKIKSVTLDIYPSRTCFKLAGKLPQPIHLDRLIFTPLAVLSLHSKLLASQAPRILATFWASHLPRLFEPRNVVVDYSTLDVRALTGSEERKSWSHTFGGMGVALQQWGRLDKVELRGEMWSPVVAPPGVEVKMVHTDYLPPQGESADRNEEDVTNATSPVTTPSTPQAATPQTNAGEATLTPRAKLINDRKGALLLGLCANHQILLHAQHQALTPQDRLSSYVPGHFITKGGRGTMISWQVDQFFPPFDENEEDDQDLDWEGSGERREEVERREVVAWLLAEMDEHYPELAMIYGRMVKGRRELCCLRWT